jgi:hypothetical protein
LLYKREVFLTILPTPLGIFLVGYKWVFIRKWNENNEVVRYKARLMEQGFMQRHDIDFNKYYFSVMNGIILWCLISLVVQNHLSIRLMDVVTTYLYGSLDYEITQEFLRALVYQIPKKITTCIVSSCRSHYMSWSSRGKCGTID